MWGNTIDKHKDLANLRAHVMRLGHALGRQGWRLRSTNTTLSLDVTDMYVDLFDYKRDLESAKRNGDPNEIEAVLGRYIGDFQPRSEATQIKNERDSLLASFIGESDALASRLARENRRARGLQVLWRTFRLYPHIEEVVALILRYCEDDPREAGKVYRWHLKSLGVGRALSQRLEDQSRQIARFRIAPERGSRRSAATIPERFDNVPVSQHPLIGRAEELERIINRLAQSSLVALTGPAGVGKTRLALEIGVRRTAAYRNGAVFVDLSQLAAGESVETIADAIRAALDLEAAANSALDLVSTFLTKRHILLILDNVEHLISSAAELASTLLAVCKGLTILVTSQVEFETEFAVRVRIDPMPIPDEDTATVADMRDYGAMQLFEYIARKSMDNYVLTDNDATTVARIVRATDGMPIAIFLVASARSLSLRELLNHVEHGLSSVEQPSTMTIWLARRTPMQAVSWSYSHALHKGKQQLLAGFSRFLPASGSAMRSTSVFGNSEFGDVKPTALLDRLHARSLIERRELGGLSRYRLLGMVREYALSRLRKSNAYENARQRHLDYYLECVEAVAKVKDGPELNEALARLTARHGKSEGRAGLQSVVEPDGEIASPLATGLVVCLFYTRGLVSEGQTWMRRVISLSADAPPELRRKAYHGIATIAYIRNDYERSQTYWDQCLVLSTDCKDENWILQDRGNLGNVALALDQFTRAKSLFEQCLQGFRARNNLRGAARSLANLALVARGEKDYNAARDIYSESIAIFRQLNDNYNLTLGLNNLASILISGGQYPASHSALAEAIELGQEQENYVNLAHSLSNYVTLAIQQLDPERAAILIGGEEKLREEISMSLPMDAQVEYQQSRIRIIGQLGQDTFTAMINVGRSASMHQLCAYARSIRDLQGDVEKGAVK